MRAVFARFRVLLFIGVISGGGASSPLFAIEDVLDTPALESRMASQSLLLDVTVAGNRLITVGSRGHILLSDDEGKSWRQAEVPVSVLLTALSFSDASNGWAVGHGGVILYSSDGGEIWIRQFDGNQVNQKIIVQAESQIELLEQKLETTRGGDIESTRNALKKARFVLDDAKIDARVGASKPFLDVLFLSKKEGFAVGAYGFIFKTMNGGKVWENYGARLDNPNRLHLNCITRIGGGTLLVAGEKGVLFRSSDNGETWEAIESPYKGSFFGISGTGDHNAAIAFGLMGHVFRSDDGGQTWVSIDSGTRKTLMGAGYNGAGKLSIVGNSGSVLYSKDGGRTFSERIRKNRLSNVSVVYLDESRMVMVGENGVNLTNAAGQNL